MQAQIILKNVNAPFKIQTATKNIIIEQPISTLMYNCIALILTIIHLLQLHPKFIIRKPHGMIQIAAQGLNNCITIMYNIKLSLCLIRLHIIILKF